MKLLDNSRFFSYISFILRVALLSFVEFSTQKNRNPKHFLLLSFLIESYIARGTYNAIARKRQNISEGEKGTRS